MRCGIVAASCWSSSIVRPRATELAIRAAWLCLAIGACALPPPPVSPPLPRWHAADVDSGGEEAYSAWFGDADPAAEVLYFGLSPFWELWWDRAGDAQADLEHTGDWQIGRFDLVERRLLAPLVVARERRSSVWDVLAHSNGWVYFTTFYEEMGRAHARTGEVELFDHLGTGYNELVEAADGRVWVSRYAQAPGPSGGSVVALEVDGRRVLEWPLPAQQPGEQLAPKALALGPDGDLWLAADVFAPDGAQGQTTLHLAADGSLLERRAAPELMFAAFDARGRGWFVEDRAGRVQLRVERPAAPPVVADLGARGALDFAQDLHFDAADGALITFWSGRLIAARLDEAGALQLGTALAAPPARCRPPRGRGLFHSGVLRKRRMAVTVNCAPGGEALVYDAPAPAMLPPTP